MAPRREFYPIWSRLGMLPMEDLNESADLVFRMRPGRFVGLNASRREQSGSARQNVSVKRKLHLQS